MRAMIVVLLVHLAVPAAAQDHPLRLPATLFLASAEADALTTFWGQKAGLLEEVNPMYAHMSPEASLALGHVTDLATVWVATKIGKQHPKLAALGLYAMALLRAEMVRENLQNIRKGQARRARRGAAVPIVVINLGTWHTDEPPEHGWKRLDFRP